jgi:hypothetical protein
MITKEQAQKDCGWLGTITAIHSIGAYDLVEYVQKEISNSPDNGKTFYSVFCDGVNAGMSCPSIDTALLSAIARRNIDEPNTARWMCSAAEKLLLNQSI